MADRSEDLIPVPPNRGALTAYDRAHFVTYLKLLDADAMGVDWKETARDVLLLDPNADTATASPRLRRPSLARSLDDAGRLSTALEDRLSSPVGTVPSLTRERRFRTSRSCHKLQITDH